MSRNGRSLYVPIEWYGFCTNGSAGSRCSMGGNSPAATIALNIGDSLNDVIVFPVSLWYWESVAHSCESPSVGPTSMVGISWANPPGPVSTVSPITNPSTRSVRRSIPASLRHMAIAGSVLLSRRIVKREHRLAGHPLPEDRQTGYGTDRFPLEADRDG